MQLNNDNIKHKLYLASCALLATSASAEEWDFDTALMYYGESDRVQAVEGIMSATKTFNADHTFSTKLVFDSLTGASASGAIPQSSAQTFTRPSGNGNYQIDPGQTPLDDTFRDTRVQISSQWQQPLGEHYLFSTGANFSNEYDYQSLSVDGTLGRYFNNKNTTLSLGLSYALDAIDPVGGRPKPFAEMVIDQGQFLTQDAFSSAFSETRQTGGDDDKNTLDLSLSLTQVISPLWITQLSIGLSEVDGYLNDPYKILSVIDTQGRALQYLYESRPDSRSKMAFYAESKYHFSSGIWGVSYRLTDDDWGIQSHTLETRYRFNLGGRHYIEPHLRYYDQQAADFFMPYLFEAAPLPNYASADYRIGDLMTTTIGLKYGQKFENGTEYGIRLEWYHQKPKSNGQYANDALSQYELYPELDALVMQIGYRF